MKRYILILAVALTGCVGVRQDPDKYWDEKADLVVRMLAGQEIPYGDYQVFISSEAIANQYPLREAAHRKGITDQQLIDLRFQRNKLFIRYDNTK